MEIVIKLVLTEKKSRVRCIVKHSKCIKLDIPNFIQGEGQTKPYSLLRKLFCVASWHE